MDIKIVLHEMIVTSFKVVSWIDCGELRKGADVSVDIRTGHLPIRRHNS